MTAHVSESTQTPDRAVAAALAGSAAASAAVPVGEAGPGVAGPLAEAALAWRWVVGTEALDLYAVQPGSPHWRVTCLGAGGALHRARVALAAEGLEAHITLLPEPSDRPGLVPGDRARTAANDRGRNGTADRGWGALPSRSRGGAGDRGRRGAPETPHLARLVVTGTIEITDEARALYDATDETASRDDAPTTDDRHARAPVRGVARELVRAARAEGVRLRLIRDGGEFIGVLHGPDTGEAWLRAGMACSAVRLLARRLGLHAVTSVPNDDQAQSIPLSPARPDRLARSGMRLIGDREGWLNVGIGTPYLRLRLAPIPG